MYMFLTPPIRRCFFCAFLYFVGAIIGRRCLFFYHHPSVGFADSSPLWEPYKMPLLEERWHAVTEWWQKRDGALTSLFPFSKSVGAIIGRRCLFFYHHPSVGFADSSPLWEPYKMPLLEERWHAVTEWWQKRDGALTSLFPFSKSVGAIIGRRCLFFYHHPSVGFADSSPLWEPYKMPLLEERWHAVTEWWQKRTSWCRPFSHTH